MLLSFVATLKPHDLVEFAYMCLYGQQDVKRLLISKPALVQTSQGCTTQHSMWYYINKALSLPSKVCGIVARTGGQHLGYDLRCTL